MSAPVIPTIKNMELFRQQLNAALASLYASSPGSGSALPDVATQPEGRLFVRTSDQTLHQVQGGAWVLVAT